MSRLGDVFLDTKELTTEQVEHYGQHLAVEQRGVNWWIGDVARYARNTLKLGDNYSQVFPEWVSPGLIQRCEAVAAAYPKEADRNPLATWTIHMRHANHPDRIALVAATVEDGLTSDESRQATGQRWLLAVDVNYFLHRFWFSGAGIEAAVSVADWLERTVERLKDKGLTDVACCMDSKINHRKQLTETWDDKYKDRPPKDPELGHQLNMVSELLHEKGFCVVTRDGMEGDDLMASYAKQFSGNVTILTQDKDCRQCLSDKCNMLLDVEWVEDETTGEHRPDYKWLSAKQHTEATGIRPDQWTEFQTLWGDNVDGIKGAVGIGEKGAAQLIQEFGSVDGAIQAAKDGDERIKPAKIASLIEFESKAETTRQLVTLRDDLELPGDTRI